MNWGQATLTQLARLLRGGGEHSLVVLDVVGLAAHNLQQGRVAGDTVLSSCARMLHNRLTAACVEHWIGDQYLVLFPHAPATLAQQLVRPVLGPNMATPSSTTYWLRGGGATSSPAATTNLIMVRTAAEAMAQAKGHAPGTLVWADLVLASSVQDTTETGRRASGAYVGE